MIKETLLVKMDKKEYSLFIEFSWFDDFRVELVDNETGEVIAKAKAIRNGVGDSSFNEFEILHTTVVDYLYDHYGILISYQDEL